MIHYIKGDATDPCVKDGVRIIPHVCNNCGGWGSGFVVSLSKRWPEPERRYRLWRNELYPGIQMPLGQIQMVPVNTERTLFVANMIAQHDYKSVINPVPLSYDALEKCLMRLNRWINSFEMTERLISLPYDIDNTTIHMPRIGCGLAGGSWDQVEALIKSRLQDHNIYVYNLRK